MKQHEAQTTLVAGVDDCRGGWLLVIASLLDRRLRVESVMFVPGFDAVLRDTAACSVIAVDMPIGLSDGPPRLADAAARRLLGPRRASSVFPPPPRAALACTEYREACDASFRVSGKMLSKQAFGILPRIREVDELMTPALQERVFEVHPELAFRALNGGTTVAASKHELEGLAQRAALLRSVYDADVSELPVPSGARRDDLYDACVCVWTASRIARGVAGRVPALPCLDAHGLRMEIAF